MKEFLKSLNGVDAHQQEAEESEYSTEESKDLTSMSSNDDSCKEDVHRNQSSMPNRQTESEPDHSENNSGTRDDDGN